MYCVYWIYLNDTDNPLTDGYVGITKDLYERIRSHRKNKKITKLTSFLKAHPWDEVKLEILDMNLSLEEALELEQFYRPEEMIGLNLQRGGELGVNPEWYSIKENREQHSKATSKGTKQGILNKDSTEARRIRAKLSWDNPNRKRNSVAGSSNPNAVLTEEQVKSIKYDLIPRGLTNPEIAKQFSVHPRVIRFIRIGKTWKHV